MNHTAAARSLEAVSRLAGAAAEYHGQVPAVVSGTGPGIPKESLPRRFEPFHPATSRRTGGGPGLATVHALASRYAGCVTVASEPGNTAFQVLLPASR